MGQIGHSEPGRRIMLRRLYARYAADSTLAGVRNEAKGVLVPGDGPMYPRLMFVGEAPGAREAALRKPFVGASGNFLNELLESVGLNRTEIYITNVVKYRPHLNRDPTDAEVHAGIPYLRREHRIIGRPPMVMLGKHARKTVEEEYRLPMGLTVGEWFTLKDGTHVLPLYHPAYGIYQRSNRPLMFEQFKKVLDAPE